MKPPFHRKSGMTLVELLAILAIASVLFVMVFSGVGKMVERSRESRCVQNLRQLYQGFMAYANDYNGKLPFGVRDPDITDVNANYYGGQYGKEFKAYIPGGPNSNTGHVEPYLCPSDHETRPATGTGRGFLGHSYGVNMTICRNEYNRIANWKYPARTFLLADSKSSVISRTSPASNLAPRHRGGANTLFLDGHVEWRPEPFPDWHQDRGFWVPDYE